MPWNYVQVDDGADCAGQEDPSIAHEADSTSPILYTSLCQSTLQLSQP